MTGRMKTGRILAGRALAGKVLAGGALAAALALTPAAALAQAADPVRAEVARTGAYVRIAFIWPEADSDLPIAVETSIDNQVLVIRFSREIDLDLTPILNGLGAEVALARLDPDGRTLRLALRAPARTFVSRSYNFLAVDLLPPEAADPAPIVSPRAEAEAEARRRAAEAEAMAEPEPPAPLPRLSVRRASSPAFDRIVFEWPDFTEYALREEDGAYVLTFSRDAEPDLGSLRADPPARLRTIEARHADGRLSVRFVPAPGAAPRAFRERNAVILDLAASDGSDSALLAQLQDLAESAAIAAAPAETPAPPPAEPEPAPAAPEPAPAMEAAAPERTPEPADAAPAPEPAPPASALADAGAPTRLIDPPAPETADAEPVMAQAAPAPEGAVIVRAAPLGGDLLLEFPFAEPVRAAAFRRADAIWIVFDSEAGLDISAVARGQRHVADAQALSGPGYSAMRINVAPAAQITARGAGADGRNWEFVLAEHMETPPAPVRIERHTEEDGPSRLFASLPGAAPAIRIPDPGVGDMLVVAPAPGPARGVLERRELLSLTILPSSQGLAVQALSHDVAVHSAPEGVWITPPRGFGAGPVFANPGRSPALIDFARPADNAGFEAARASAERAASDSARASAYVDLARFLLSRELGIEALGALNLALERESQLSADPDFRTLRGIANALAGRLAQADQDLSLPQLERDETTQLWRGWIKTGLGEWAAARRAFADGERMIPEFAPHWRARFHEAYARTALALNDLAAARRQIDLAGAGAADAPAAARIALAAARWRQAAGQAEDALGAYDSLIKADEPETGARAMLAAAMLRFDLGRAGPAETIEALESLRWRWRGDDVELEAIRALGALYAEENRDREALEAMNAAVARFPNHPVSRAMFTEMMDMFAALFLRGEADRLDPVEALALYFQFSDLTPAGADGDRMIRRLSERLVAFDLLPQAAELLQHQVDQRLHEPRARAQVAADLALIYLMDRRPEAALRVLRASRVTGLSPSLAEERRITEARALAALDAGDSALDLIAGDPSVEAARLRADIAWQARDWPLAAQRLEELLGERWAAPGPLSDTDAAASLRAAVAYSLAEDQAGLARMAERYTGLIQGAPGASAFAAVTQRLETSGLRLAEIANRAADVTALETFLERRRGRLEASPRASVTAQGGAAEPQALAAN